jgi:hypothetical protein
MEDLDELATKIINTRLGILGILYIVSWNSNKENLKEETHRVKPLKAHYKRPLNKSGK